MPRCPPSPGSKGRADRPARQQKGGHTMTGAAVSFAGNLTDNPELRHTDSGIARAMFRVAVSGRREQEPSFFTVIVWRDQAEHAAQSLSKGSRVVVVGRLQQRTCPLRTATPDPWSRSWPRSWGQASVGRRRPRPGPRAATSRTLSARARLAVPGAWSRDGTVKTGQVRDDDRRPGGTPEASSAHLRVRRNTSWPVDSPPPQPPQARRSPVNNLYGQNT
jgi:Single-strand binding protein family